MGIFIFAAGPFGCREARRPGADPGMSKSGTSTPVMLVTLVVGLPSLCGDGLWLGLRLRRSSTRRGVSPISGRAGMWKIWMGHSFTRSGASSATLISLPAWYFCVPSDKLSRLKNQSAPFRGQLPRSNH